MRKTDNALPAPLKAKGLSALRDLQRQATKHAAQKAKPGDTSPTESSSPEGTRTSPGRPARRPHRFFPPGTGTNNPYPARHTTTPGVKAADADSVLASASETPAPETLSVTTGRAASPVPEPAPATTLEADDIALFRRVVQSVTPAPRSNRALLPPVPDATPAQLRQRRQHAMGQRPDVSLDVSDQYAPASLDHDDTVFLQAGQGPHLIKGLKKGKWPAQASLDLHGSTLDNARERMDRFIQSCIDHQIRCVRIVHGKGYGSKNGDPVLKETVRRWLSQLAIVQAYIECDEANGGAGAVLVLLSRNKS